MSKLKGGFTLPGESGFEKLTLDLAEKWVLTSSATATASFFPTKS